MRRYLDGGAGRRPDATGEAYHWWVRPPAQPIRYGSIQRWVDWRNGRLDGARSIPSLPPADPDPSSHEWHDASLPAPPAQSMANLLSPISTFYVDSLCKRFDAVAAREKEQTIRRLGPLEKTLVGAVERREMAAKKLKSAEAALESAAQPPSEGVLQIRHAAEDELNRPAYLSRQRRLTQYARAHADAETQYADIDREWCACNEEVADLRNQISTERKAMKSRVQAQLAHTERRIATYWKHLIRRHERGAELNERLRPAGPRLPDWARDDTDGDEEH